MVLGEKLLGRNFELDCRFNKHGVQVNHLSKLLVLMELLDVVTTIMDHRSTDVSACPLETVNLVLHLIVVFVVD